MSAKDPWNSVDEDAFHRLLSDAQGLADITEKMVSDVPGDLWFEDASLYPGATILHLERWAATEFAGGLLLLTQPQVANASIPLLRGILESYSHAYWIRQGSGKEADSQAGRALCYELTIARELRDAVSNAPKEVTTADAIPEAKRRVANLEKLLNGLGFKCKGRDYTDVLPTIREIAKSEPDLEWLPEMVRATRMTSHQAQRDRIMRVAEDGAIEVGVALSPWERSVLLEWLTAIFARLGREIAFILAPTSQDELSKLFVQIRDRIRFLRDDLTRRALSPSTSLAPTHSTPPPYSSRRRPTGIVR